MLGVIGGSGLYRLPGLEDTREEEVKTPFGAASGPVTLGTLQGKKIAFIPRHGQNHQFLPDEIPFRANIWALKSVGVTRLLSVSAVGSLSEEIAPGHLAVVGQYLDFTGGARTGSFFGGGIIGHISMAQPVCASFSETVSGAARKLTPNVHNGGTYVCVRGPRFGTKAESHFFRHVKCDLVGMTNVPEAFLAREAQICYSSVGVVTDYDCWMEDQSQHVTVDEMMVLYGKNLETVKRLIGSLVGSPAGDCRCRKALTGGLLTPLDKLSPSQREMVGVLLK